MSRVIFRGVSHRCSSHVAAADTTARRGASRYAHNLAALDGTAPATTSLKTQLATAARHLGGGGRGVMAPLRRAAPTFGTRGFAASATASEEPEQQQQQEEEEEGERRERRKREDADEAHGVTQRLLTAAMKHVAAGGGWTEASLQAAAADLGYSPAVVGQLPRGKGSLVEHFVEECDSRLAVLISTKHDELADMSARERLVTVMQWRLDMLEPYVESWASALAIQAAPENVPTTLRQRALLADELCAAAGPGLGLAHVSHGGGGGGGGGFELAAAGWYSDRAAVAALYSTSELFMLTDTSPGFADTRAFVAARVGEMSEVAKTIEEVGGFAAAAAKGLPTMSAGGSGFPPLPPGGREALEGFLGKVASAVLGGGVKGR